MPNKLISKTMQAQRDFKIMSTLWLTKKSSTKSLLHLVNSPSIKSETQLTMQPSLLVKEPTLYGFVNGNHWSFQTSIRSPLPTCHLQPFLTNSLAGNKLRQIKLRDASKSTLKKIWVRKLYELGCLIIKQYCLPSTATLKSNKDWKPKRPILKRCQTYFKSSCTLFLSN